MLRIIDKLHTVREENFKCPVCKEYLQNPEIRLLAKCGHLYCTPCVKSLCKEDSSVICSVCKTHQSEEEILLGDNVFNIAKQSFGQLVQLLREYCNLEGDDEAINALITKTCMKTGQSNKQKASYADRKEKRKSTRTKREGKLVQKEDSGISISNDDESLEKTIRTDVAVGNLSSATKNGDESPASSDSSGVFTDISVNGLNAWKNHNFVISDSKNCKHNVCKSINDIQNDKNVKENDVDMETIDDSETCSKTIFKKFSPAGIVTVNTRSNKRLQTLKSDTLAGKRSAKQSSQVGDNSVCVQKTLNSSRIKCHNIKKKSSFSNSSDSILNDISNILDNTSENKTSPHKQELNRILKKKKVDSFSSKSHKSNENIEVMSSAADEERENSTSNNVYRTAVRQLFPQMRNEADCMEEEKQNYRFRGTNPYSKQELKNKKLSLSRRQNINKTSELKEDSNKISSQIEDKGEKLKDVSNTECRDISVNVISELMQVERVANAADDNLNNAESEKTSNHVQDIIMEVCNQTDDATGLLKDSMWNVESQSGNSNKTDDCNNMENLPDIQNFDNSSKISNEHCTYVEDEIMDHNENVETNESQKEMLMLDGTLGSPGEYIQRMVSPITIHFNDSFLRKDETGINYLLHTNMEEDSTEKKEETADEDEVVEATPTDTSENKSVGGLLPDPVPVRNACFENQNFKSFNLEISLIDKDGDLLSINKFNERFNGTFGGRKSAVTIDTTHLIMKTNENNRVHQTFKYLQAIVLHKPVVSFDWIQQSLKCGQPLPEEEFLVHGENGENAVELSLLNSDDSLFQNFSILILDPELSGLRSCKIEDLLITGGAYVVNNDVFRKVPRSLFKIVLTDAEITENLCREHCVKYSAITLPGAWVFDSIAEYKLAHWQKYVPRTIRKIILYEFRVIEGPLYISSDEEDD